MKKNRNVNEELTDNKAVIKGRSCQRLVFEQKRFFRDNGPVEKTLERKF